MGGKTASIAEDTPRTENNQDKLEVPSEREARYLITTSARY